MKTINPYEFERAPENSLFIKKGNDLVAVSFDELAKALNAKCDGVLNFKHKVNVISKSLAEFKKLSKRHFITVFTLFELKVLKGELEVNDEEILNLDEKVLKDEISVEQAVNEFHPYLKETFNALYGKEYDSLQDLVGKDGK